MMVIKPKDIGMCFSKLRVSGIYKITNIVNGKFYIGSAINLYERWRKHIYWFRKNKHQSWVLQKAWDKYGEDNFSFEVIEFVDKLDTLKREQFYIDTLNPEYNICRVAGSRLGMKNTLEHNQCISRARKGSKMSEEAKRLISQRMKERGTPIWLVGKPLSEKHKKNLSLSKKGKPKSEEWKKKMSEIHTGKKPTQETIEKVRKGNLEYQKRKREGKL